MVKILRLLVFSAFLFLLATDTLYASTYYGYDDIGGQWYDAQKSGTTTDDDNLCWAATASNMLAYSGWGFPEGSNFTGADDIFGHFQEHWTNQGGSMYYGTEWWFDGNNSRQGEGSWSQVDDTGGGNFYSAEAFLDAYTWNSDDARAMDTVDRYLHNGYGVGLSIRNEVKQEGHAITVWGFDSDENDYLGIYVTDSDDANPSHLAYYDVMLNDTKWYFNDFNDNQNEWYISEVHGLAQMSATTVPIPSTLILLGSGLLCLRPAKRKVRHRPF